MRMAACSADRRLSDSGCVCVRGLRRRRDADDDDVCRERAAADDDDDDDVDDVCRERVADDDDAARRDVDDAAAATCAKVRLLAMGGCAWGHVMLTSNNDATEYSG